jgi:endonuclease/exonuclease/phosphatase family metal-dependent hydrolase
MRLDMMIWRAVLVALTFLFAPFSSARAQDSAAIRVMTYNIRLDTEADGANAWPHRRAALSGLLRFYAPDIFGLQEVRLHQRDQLIADLGDYVFLGVGRDDGREGGEFSSLAFRRDRFRLIEQGGFWLSPTPDRPSRGWDAAFPRIVTWARLHDRRSGRRILALDTHWDHVGVEARLASGQMIRDWIAAQRTACENVVLLGDFNAPPSEASYRALVQSGELLDAKSVSETPPFGPAGTFNGFDIIRADAQAIDHVLISEGVRVLRHGVLTQHDAGRLPSDHYPVLADIIAPRCHAH